MVRQICYCLFFILLSGCSLWKYQADYVETNPRVDTKSRLIDYQDKKVYSFNNGELKFDNLFDGARLNNCIQLNDSTFEIAISPENEPINSSPWYAFRMISQSRDNIWLRMTYKNAKHRYHPKISNDGENWQVVSNDRVTLSNHDSIAIFKITPESDTSWLAAQEIINTEKVRLWCSQQADKKNIKYKEYGKSKLGRPLPVLDICSGKKRGKPIVVILSRQHPPEVTGFFAMQAFVETITETNALTDKFLEQYRVLVFPLLNPDGVDLGHWRHNAGGVDLNRDWGNYKQAEIRQIADYIVTMAKRAGSEVLVGFDFHSTYRDIYYTNSTEPNNDKIAGFKDLWLSSIEKGIEGYKVKEKASGTKPVAVSKSWFHEQLQAVGITYEIGDNTPRDFIKTKGRISAQAMMEILIML